MTSGRSAKRVVVTGGAGFIGCNLVDRLASDGHTVVVYDSLSRPGVERNLDWLLSRHSGAVERRIADVRDEAALGEALSGADCVFHLAAQVAVTTSLHDPRQDFEINVGGALAVLETARRLARRPVVIFASTNKVYGDLSDVALREGEEAYAPLDPQTGAHGVSESRPLAFHTPYGCSKGAADQYVLDYSRSFDLPTCVLRMSCIYGPHQMGNEDQGWVAHFAIRALEEQPISIYGDGKQVRDVLHVEDAVNAYLAAWRRIDECSGRAYNLGGGPANAISLRQLVNHIERLVDRPVRLRYGDWREGDQRYYVSDARRITNELHLPAPRAWREGVADLMDWLARERGLALPSFSGAESAR